ncbi:hypothetical protein IFM89_009394 [Coptis chinensis]|uniref:Uncharacterized protein n=1 Tax=Coptis chinensis TaxID=261450 RepID=A0A835HJ90_9MAGN|nr:hypothetical protein IFM89_009394 [Coptis chinensis]
MSLNIKRNAFFFLIVCFVAFVVVNAEDLYKYFTWTVSYGNIVPLGVSQHVSILNGIQQRKNSWQDGVYGTNCPIPPGRNFTYTMQVKDQIGSFFYFPSLNFHKAACGFGGIRILSRPQIPVPFPEPSGDYTVLIGDWYTYNNQHLKDLLDQGRRIASPEGILINGRGPNGAFFRVEEGKTYRFRISNVGLQNSLNFRIQGHAMKLVEVEGTHTVQTTYSSLDVHVGQSYSVLVKADQPAKDYYIAVSTRFTSPVLSTTGILYYSNSPGQASGPIPTARGNDIDFSLNQARSIRTNLTASGPRLNPQGSYYYGRNRVTRTIRLANSAGSIPDNLIFGGMRLETSVMVADFRSFVEIVFENNDDTVQSWHLDGYNAFVVGMDIGMWTSDSRRQYNLRDAISCCTIQVRYLHLA